MTIRDKRLNDAIRDRVIAQCTFEEGEYVRGRLDLIVCHGCSEKRYDDGTPCHNCGVYSRSTNPKLPANFRCLFCGSLAARFSYSIPVCSDNDTCLSMAKHKAEELLARRAAAQ